MQISFFQKIVLRFFALSLLQKLGIISFLLGMLMFLASVVLFVIVLQDNFLDKSETLEEREDVLISGTPFPQEESSGSAEMIVSVTGAVKKPGVFSLSPNSRVADAIQAAQGFEKHAASEWLDAHLNLAQAVTNEMQIYIPPKNAVELCLKESEPSLNATKDEEKKISSEKINVNTALKKELMELRGIGEARAEEIVKNRPYTNFQDFVERSTLSTSLLNELSNQIEF